MKLATLRRTLGGVAVPNVRDDVAVIKCDHHLSGLIVGGGVARNRRAPGVG